MLKHLADFQQHNIVASLRTISKHFAPDKIDVKEILKFLTDMNKFNTEQFTIINLKATNVAIFAKAHTHPSGKGNK